MKLGIFHVHKLDHPHCWDFYHLGELCVISAKLAMPHVEIVHLTDMESPELRGVDRVRRISRQAPLMQLRIEHQAGVDGEWLFLDTDTWVQRDVTQVFNDPFDIALPDQPPAETFRDPEMRKIREKMPFATGVVFSRCPEFWEAVLERMLQQPAERREWFGEQMAASQVIETGKFDVKILPRDIYGRRPQSETDDLSQAAIIPYAGNRKVFMMRRAIARLAELEGLAWPTPR